MVIAIVLFVLTIVAYHRNHPAWVLILLYAMTSNCFYLIDLHGSPIRVVNLQQIIVLYISVSEFIKSPHYFSIKNDKIGQILIITFSVMLVCTLGTIVLRLDSPLSATLAIRSYLLYLLYFYLRKQDFAVFEKTIKLCLVFSTIQGVFYLLQFVGLNGFLIGEYDEDGGALNYLVRYRNEPKLSMLLVVYSFVADTKLWKKIFFITFFGACLVLAQGRGLILASGASILIYYILKGDKKIALYIGGALLVFQLVIAPMFEHREQYRSTSTFEEISMVVTDPASIYTTYTEDGGGTFLFRIAMLSERIIYLLDNPQYLPFGVGTIDEYSPHNDFYFTLGTVNESATYGRTMLASADIEWVGVIMHFGFIGVFVLALLLYRWCRDGIHLIRSDSNAIVIAASMLSFAYVLISFDGAWVTRGWLVMLFSISAISNYLHNNELT